MLVICKFSEGYSDLTVGKVYEVIRETEGGYTIIDDSQDQWTYFKALFQIIIDKR